MKCKTIMLGGVAAIACASPPRKRKCKCGALATKFCDYPKIGGGTCDKPLCVGCAVHAEPDLGYCPEHLCRSAA